MTREELCAHVASIMALLEEVRVGAEVVNGGTRFCDKDLEGMLSWASMRLREMANALGAR